MTHPRLTLGVAYSPKTSTEQTTEFGTFENEYSLLRGAVGLEVPLLDADDPFTRGSLVADIGLSQLSGDYTNRGSHRTQGELSTAWRQNFFKYLNVEGRVAAGYGSVAFNSGRGYEPEAENALGLRYAGLLGANIPLPDGSDILPQVGWFFEHNVTGPDYTNHGPVFSLAVATNFLGGGGPDNPSPQVDQMSPEQILAMWKAVRPKDSPELQRLRELLQEVVQFDGVLAKAVEGVIQAYETNGITPEGNFEIQRLNTLIEQMLAKDKVLGFPMIYPFAVNNPDIALQPRRENAGGVVGAAIECYCDPRLDVLAQTLLRMAQSASTKKSEDGKRHSVVFRVNIESSVVGGSTRGSEEHHALVQARAEGIKAYLTRQGSLSHLRELAQLKRKDALTKKELEARLKEATEAEKMTMDKICSQSITDPANYVSKTAGDMAVSMDVQTKINIIDKGQTLFDAVVIQVEVVVDGEVLTGKKRIDFITGLIGVPMAEPKAEIL